MHFLQRCFRKILKISYKDHVRNIEVLERTGMTEVTQQIQQRRLRWLGHVFRMKDQRIPKMAMEWKKTSHKRGRGRPKTTWRSTVEKDLRDGEMTWEEANTSAQNRDAWRTWMNWMAQCVKDTGGTKC